MEIITVADDHLFDDVALLSPNVGLHPNVRTLSVSDKVIRASQHGPSDPDVWIVSPISIISASV